MLIVCYVLASILITMGFIAWKDLCIRHACNTGTAIVAFGTLYNVMRRDEYEEAKVQATRRSALELEIADLLTGIGELKSDNASLEKALRDLDTIMKDGQMHSTATIAVIELALED